MAEGRISVAKDGPIGRLVIDNEERRNALSFGMWQAIPAAIGALEQDPDVRVIVLVGAGDKAFAAGADISQFESERGSADQAATYSSAVAAACDAIEGAKRPTIAMLRGYCIGGGVAIATSCDLRIAADDLQIGIPAARLGIGYPLDGLRRLVHLVGPATAREIMFTGDRYGAEDALRMGLVNRVVPRAELADFVADTAGRIAENAPLSIVAAARCIRAVLSPEADVGACHEAVSACTASADYAEGRRSFAEKRKPMFRGR